MSKFVVELVDYRRDRREKVLEALQRTLKLSERKAERLLENLPRVITKPISEKKATAIETQFRKVGLIAYSKFYATEVNHKLTFAGTHKQTPVGGDEPKSLGIKRDADIGAGNMGAGNIGAMGFAQSNVFAGDEPLSGKQSNKIDKQRYESDSFESSNFESNDFGSETDKVEGTAQNNMVLTPNKPDFAGIREAYSSLKAQYEQPDEAERRVEEAKLPASGISLRSKITLASLLPAALLALGSLLTLFLILQPLLRGNLIDAITLPSQVITETISDNLFFERLDTNRNRSTIEGNLLRLNRVETSKDLRFVAIADDVGRVVSLWSSEPNFAREFSPQVIGALGDSYPLGLNDVRYFPHPTNKNITLVSRSLEKNGVVMGASFTGVTNQSVRQQFGALLREAGLPILATLLASIVLSLAIGEILTRGIRRLIRSARRLSRGDLNNRIDMRYDDELSELAESLERIRLDLKHEQNQALRR